MGEGGLGLGYLLPAPKSTTLDDVAKRPRESPRPAKVEPVATEQEPHAGMAGLFSLVDQLTFAYLIPTPYPKCVRCHPHRVGRRGCVPVPPRTERSPGP